MKEYSPLNVWTWRLVSVPPLYAALTLAAATLAAPPENPNDLFGNVHRAFVPVADALPGAGVWPQLMNLNTRLGGALPVSLVLMIVLVLIGLGAVTQAKRIASQIREDNATARDEAIRDRVRRGGR